MRKGLSIEFCMRGISPYTSELNIERLKVVNKIIHKEGFNNWIISFRKILKELDELFIGEGKRE